MKNKVLVALDQTEWSQIERLASALKGSGCGMKVGMELFYAHGNKAVEFLAHEGFFVFLDLKLHDIPTTVEKAMSNLLKLPANIYNVHAAGGLEMLQAAKRALEKSQRKDAKIIAVTQLTSTSEIIMQQQMRIPGKLIDCVEAWAKMTLQAGLDGVVCSPLEAKHVKAVTHDNFLCITPGIRPKGVSQHDQKRTLTPREALANGSDYLVIGRALSEASDPRGALEDLTKETL